MPLMTASFWPPLVSEGKSGTRLKRVIFFYLPRVKILLFKWVQRAIGQGGRRIKAAVPPNAFTASALFNGLGFDARVTIKQNCVALATAGG